MLERTHDHAGIPARSLRRGTCLAAHILLTLLTLALCSSTALAQGAPSSETLMKILDTEWQLAGVVGLDFMEAYLAHTEGITPEARAPVDKRIKALRKGGAKSLKKTWGTFHDSRKSFDFWKKRVRYWPDDQKGILERMGTDKVPLKGPCAKLVTWQELLDGFAGCSGKARSQAAKNEANRRAAIQQNAATLNYKMAGGKGGYMIDTSFDAAAWKSEKVGQMRSLQCMALTMQATCFNKLEKTALDRAGIGQNYRAIARKKPLGVLCAKGDGDACAKLAGLMRKTSPNRASFLFTTACSLGVHRVCKDELEYDDKSSKLRLPKTEHLETVLPFYQKACDAGDAKGCRKLGATYDKIVDCLGKRARDIGDSARGERWVKKHGDYGEYCTKVFPIVSRIATARAPSECKIHKDCEGRKMCHAGECLATLRPGAVERELRLVQYDAMAKACTLDFTHCGMAAIPVKYRSKFIVQDKLRELPAEIDAILRKKPVDPDCKRAPCYPKRPTKKQAASMKKWAKSFAGPCKRLDPTACTKLHVLTLLYKESYWYTDSKEVYGIYDSCYAGDWWGCYQLASRRMMYRGKKK